MVFFVNPTDQSIIILYYTLILYVLCSDLACENAPYISRSTLLCVRKRHGNYRHSSINPAHPFIFPDIKAPKEVCSIHLFGHIFKKRIKKKLNSRKKKWLSKSSWSCDNGNCIHIVPPVFQKGSLINIKAPAAIYFVKPARGNINKQPCHLPIFKKPTLFQAP